MENEPRRRAQLSTPRVGFGDRDRVQFRSSILCNFRPSMTLENVFSEKSQSTALSIRSEKERGFAVGVRRCTMATFIGTALVGIGAVVGAGSR